MHLFGRTRDHDYYFELLPQEEQNAALGRRVLVRRFRAHLPLPLFTFGALGPQD